MKCPFDWIPAPSQGRVLAVLTGLLVATSTYLFALDRALVDPVVPHGIVSFELAATEARVAEILDTWSVQAKANALWIQKIDFLYLLIYPAWFGLAATFLSRSLGRRWQILGRLVAWGVLLAAPFDAIENFALIHQLLDGADAHHAQIARACAIPKFALVLVASLFLFLAGTTKLVEGIRRGPILNTALPRD